MQLRRLTNSTGGGGGGTIGGTINQDQIAYGSALDTITGDNRHTIDAFGRTNLQMGLGGSLSTQVIVTDNVLSAGIPGSALVISDSMAGDNASFGVVDASSLGGDPFAVNAQVAMSSINLDAIFAMGQHGIDLVWDYDTTDDIATGLQMNESILAGNPGAGLFRINTTTSDTAFVAVLDETGSGGDPLTFHAGYLQGTTNVVNDIIADSTGVYINAADNANSILGKVSVEPNGSAILGAYDLANGYESSVTPDISHGRINSTIIDATATSLFQQLSTQLSYAVGGNLYLDIDVGNLSYAIGDINFNGNGTYTTWDDQNQAILNILDGEYTITNTAQTARVALFQPHVRAAIGDIDAQDSEAIVDVDIAGGNIYLYGNLHVDRGDQASGDTGDVTLNTQAGTVNFAPAMTSLVLTNNRIVSSSEILVSVSSNDATMKSAHTVKGTGSVTIYADTAPTAQTKVTFLVLN